MNVQLVDNMLLVVVIFIKNTISMIVAGGQEAQIGLVHNYMNYEPYTNTWAARLYLQPVCNTMQYVWGTSLILQYFKTGKFVWQGPIGSKVAFEEGSKPGLDWIGMNYYGRCGHLFFTVMHASFGLDWMIY